MKNIFTKLAVFVMAFISLTAYSQQSGNKHAVSNFMLELDGGNGHLGVIAPIDNKGNAAFLDVKPGTHTVALLVPAVQKVREAAARSKANGTPPPSIEVESYSWGVSQTGAHSTGGGGGAGKVSVHDISVTKAADKATPELFKSVVVSSFKAPLLTTVQHKGQEYYKIEMENVMVSSYQSGGSAGSDRPTESLSLNFSKMEFKYDLKENKK
jgi:type VI secretion system secreted protein Hcp